MAANHKKQPALGRGLSALLANSETDITSAQEIPLGSTSMLEITCIEANPFNPRTHFEQEALEELAESIKIHGIIQPLTVRKLGRDKYQLISGERRFRASQLAGLKAVPAYVRVANDQSMLEMALVENIQRENLNAIEIGLSYLRLIEDCKFTQEQLAQKISKSRSDIANHLRLLKLPAQIQAGVRDQSISMGHARALLAYGSEPEQIKAFERIIAEQLSVRAVEEINKNKSTLHKPLVQTKSQQTLELQAQLIKLLGCPTKIQFTAKGAGKMVLSFKNQSELDSILSRLKKR